MEIPVITGRQFATKFALRPQQFSWFLGAGASASAGIPTGYDMIVDFKATLFCQQTRIPRRELDSTDPIWVARIDQYFAQQGTLPPAGDPSEYARAFESVYPSIEDRRTYIAQQVQRGSPSFAHRVLAALLTAGKTPCVFTTNFDNLVETATTIAQDKLAVNQRRTLVVAAIDSVERAARSVRENDWPLLAKIHGDFQSVSLKNTEHELAVQDEKMRGVLVEVGRRFALVVAGYSGRDASVMAALNETLNAPNAYPGGIYWMTRSAQAVFP
ncbi:MAG: SIR2 family protein, partial [Lysobacteraceae bacterium]